MFARTSAGPSRRAPANKKVKPKVLQCIPGSTSNANPKLTTARQQFNRYRQKREELFKLKSRLLRQGFTLPIDCQRLAESAKSRLGSAKKRLRINSTTIDPRTFRPTSKQPGPKTRFAASRKITNLNFNSNAKSKIELQDFTSGLSLL